MAYFSNGAEGEIFDNECAECILGKEACPIFLVQSIYNYKACNNEVARAILNDLVKQDDDGRYIGCQMKSLIDSLLREESKEKTFRSAREVFKTYLPNKMNERITDILNKDFTVVCHTDDGITATDILDVLREVRDHMESAGTKSEQKQGWEEKEFEDMTEVEQLRYMIEYPAQFHAHDWIGDLMDLALKVCNHLESAGAEIERLKKYAQHLNTCNTQSIIPQTKNGKIICTCGFEQALKGE